MDIPELKLQVLTKLIKRFMRPATMVLRNLFGADKWESETIKWEAQTGNRGLAPFGSEDKPAPLLSPQGLSEHEAFAAFWHEKMRFGSRFLNNIRKAGTTQAYQKAKKYLATQMMGLRNRSDRREEWMCAQMLSNGSFSYLDTDLNVRSVDYGIPAANKVTLAGNYRWNQESAAIVSDIMDASITMSNANEAEIDYALFPSEVLKLMVLDSGIQTLLQKSAFGKGDLLADPVRVLGGLLKIKNMVLYDGQYQVRTFLTAALPSGGGAHTIYVDETRDFAVGDTLTVLDVSAKTSETVTISAVSASAGTLTATGALSSAYKGGEDVVFSTKKFLSTNKFILFASTVEGQKIAEFAQAPFSLQRKWGQVVDSWEKKDPDGVIVRCQNKGLPVLYFEDAVLIYTVTD